jgi:hypothetical protein
MNWNKSDVIVKHLVHLKLGKSVFAHLNAPQNEIVIMCSEYTLYDSANIEISLCGKFESHVTLAEWEDEPDPKVMEDVIIIKANGQIMAHVKPIASSDLESQSIFISVDTVTVNLVANGYIQTYVSTT